MKSLLPIGLTLMLFTTTVIAQQRIRIGYIDMDYILSQVPEYQEASRQLDNKAADWKNEIEQDKQRIEDMREELNNERSLLTQELIEDREDDIKFEQEQLLIYQQQRFGPDGDLMHQQLQLVQPVQDQVFNAVQEIADARNYDFIFDKSSEAVALFAKEQHDVSDQVLRRISIASKRQEVTNRQEREDLMRDEDRSPQESAEVSRREAAQEERTQEREALLEERRRRRDSIRDARQRAFEERRERVLEERQQRKDSIAKAREQREN